MTDHPTVSLREAAIQMIELSDHDVTSSGIEGLEAWKKAWTDLRAAITLPVLPETPTGAMATAGGAWWRVALNDDRDHKTKARMLWAIMRDAYLSETGHELADMGNGDEAVHREARAILSNELEAASTMLGALQLADSIVEKHRLGGMDQNPAGFRDIMGSAILTARSAGIKPPSF